MRCQKAHLFLSAQCDDTLSEKQRHELAAHLEECPACRCEAFYFSEIKGQTGKLDRVRARADFDLRLKTKIRAWETQQEQVKSTRAEIWSTLVERISGMGKRLAEVPAVVFGRRRLALVSVTSVLLVVAVWAGYRVAVGPQETGSDFAQYVVEQAGISAGDERGNSEVYLAGISETGTQSYVVPAVSLSDDISPRTQPNYVLPTIPAEQVSAREVF